MPSERAKSSNKRRSDIGDKTRRIERKKKRTAKAEEAVDSEGNVACDDDDDQKVDKPHKCDRCSYAARLLQHLTVHKRSHTGERPYSCTTCSYAASTAHGLKDHERIHSGEKPFACEDCDAAFAQQSSLAKHRTIRQRRSTFPLRLLCLQLEAGTTAPSPQSESARGGAGFQV